MADTNGNEPPEEVRLFFLHALTPLHAGTGEGVGLVNLPTARERATGLPFLPGSLVKGVLRQAARDAHLDREEIISAFGPETENAAEHRGALVLSDASLLALPVRSHFGGFAWVTSPLLLRRLARDAREAGRDLKVKQALKAFAEAVGDGGPAGAGAQEIGLAGTSTQIAAPADKNSETSDEGRRAYLDELVLRLEASEAVDALAQAVGEHVPGGEGFAEYFAQHLAVLDDTLLAFLAATALEIRSRVRIDHDRGTAADSGPWTEEHLPAETVLSGVAIGRKGRRGVTAADALETLAKVATRETVLRFGGKSTAGMGRARLSLLSRWETVAP